MWNKSKVVLLPTDKKTNCLILIDRLYKQSEYILNIASQNDWRHLYILSDEEIKEGDWFLLTIDNGSVGSPHISVSKMLNLNYNSEEDTFLALDVDGIEYHCGRFPMKKIIASTDKLLGLPEPSQVFLETYFKTYNEGNPITDVMVEYEEYTHNQYSGANAQWIEYILKIDKDNTISIRKVKDSWTKEEVIQLIRTFDMTKGKDITTKDFDKWIEENL